MPDALFDFERALLDELIEIQRSSKYTVHILGDI